MDSKLLDQGFLRWWATGNKSPLLRSRMIARAPVLATQLMIFWSFPPIILLWIIHMADTQGALAPEYSRDALCACMFKYAGPPVIPHAQPNVRAKHT